MIFLFRMTSLSYRIYFFLPGWSSDLTWYLGSVWVHVLFASKSDELVESCVFFLQVDLMILQSVYILLTELSYNIQCIWIRGWPDDLRIFYLQVTGWSYSVFFLTGWSDDFRVCVYLTEWPNYLTESVVSNMMIQWSYS